MTTNDFKVTGVDETRQWLPPFSLVDNNGNIMFSVSSVGAVSAAGNVALASGKLLDLSGVGAANAAIKIVETSDTPTVAFTDNGGLAHSPTTAPNGYLKVLVGATPFYIPVWA